MEHRPLVLAWLARQLGDMQCFCSATMMSCAILLLNNKLQLGVDADLAPCALSLGCAGVAVC